MDKKEFSHIRRQLGKTQKQMAQLLCTSQKAIESFVIPSGAECAWNAIAGPSAWPQSALAYSGFGLPGR